MFTVPFSSSGTQTISATDSSGNSDTSTFTVFIPSISLSPTNGAVNTLVTITGSHFLPVSPLTVYYDGVIVDTAIADSSGNLTSGANFNVPLSTFGSHTVAVSDGFGIHRN